MSIVQVTQGSGHVAERTLFVGPRIPDEIKRMTKHLKLLDKQTFRKILQSRICMISCVAQKPEWRSNPIALRSLPIWRLCLYLGSPVIYSGWQLLISAELYYCN